MHRQKWILVFINVAGGAAVLGSYAHGLATHPETRNALWGNVPASLMPFYTVSMLTAALGYFAFTYFVLFRLDAGTARVAGRFPYALFNWLYGLMLAPSALWMPLTFSMMEEPSQGLWFAIRAVLSLAGLASLGLLAALITVRPGEPAWARRLAVFGCALFCVQTALLDALVWTAYFPLEF
jgi:hypothetical protein